MSSGNFAINFIRLTVDDDASGALDATHIVARHQTVLTLVLGEDAWNREGRLAASELLPVLGGSVVQDLAVLLPEDIRLGLSLDVALECDGIAIAAS
jgi:hypothetical protein